MGACNSSIRSAFFLQKTKAFITNRVCFSYYFCLFILRHERGILAEPNLHERMQATRFRTSEPNIPEYSCCPLRHKPASKVRKRPIYRQYACAEELFDRRFAQRAQHQLYRCTRKTGRNGLGMPYQFRLGERALYGSAAAVDIVSSRLYLRYHIACRHNRCYGWRGTHGY